MGALPKPESKQPPSHKPLPVYSRLYDYGQSKGYSVEIELTRERDMPVFYLWVRGCGMPKSCVVMPEDGFEGASKYLLKQMGVR